MQLNIAGKDVDVFFGVRFLRELDNRYPISVNGVEFGFGLNKASFMMGQRSPVVLVDLIECGTRTAKGFKPNTQQIEEYVESMEDTEWLFEAFYSELSESNAVKKQWNQIMEEAAKTE